VGVAVDRKRIFVGGEFVEGTKGEWRGVLDPATGEVIAEVPECSEEDVDGAVTAASRAFEGWFDTTPAERSEMLHRLADVLEEHAEELALTESRNVGKPIASARSETPHGGFRESGYGKDMSAYAIEDYTVIKHVMARFG
jgi:acyl-CoA reductase-like NAD-dependent aldehyde dehydrogenase